MKRNILLVIIACLVMSCGAYKHVEQAAPSNGFTNEQLKELLAKALVDMKEKAEETGIQGVAAVAILNRGEEIDWLGDMKVVGTPYNLKGGLNLVAIAWSKCGEVIATRADSGNRDREKNIGELGYVGGAYEEFEGYAMAFAFSGGTSRQDLVVAKYGIEKMKSYLSE